ncbi:MAG: DUF6899 family protein [Candidatus Thorarchaeota archaeon]
MPYIRQNLRDVVDEMISELVETIKDNPKLRGSKEGVLNYTLTRLICESYNAPHTYPRNWRYYDINNVMGILECCKHEFYNKIARPKEENAILNNGNLRCYEN